MIQFTCPGCNKTLKAPAEKAGVAVRCPQCQQQLTVPSPAPEKTAANIGQAHKPVAPPPPPAPTAEQWYFTRNGGQQGPVTTEQLKQLAASGQLQPNDMVWKQGMAQWIQASSVQGLFSQGGPPSFSPTGPPALQTSASAFQGEWQRQLWQRLWANKILFLSLCLFLSLILTCTVPGLFHNVRDQRELARIREYSPHYDAPSDAETAVTGLFLLLDLGLVIVIAVLGIMKLNRAIMRDNLFGKWKPVDLEQPSLEFVRGGSFIRGDGFAAKFVFNHDNTIDVSEGDRIVDRWCVTKLDPKELVLKNQDGKVSRYKKELEGAAKFFKSLFSVSRLDLLVDSWLPADGTGHWIQFTKDGAFVCGDQTAGRFTLSGEEPNEIIKVQLTDNSSKQFRIVSLSTEQMVLAEGQEAKIYRRHRPKRKQSKPSSVPGSSTSESESAALEPPAESESEAGNSPEEAGSRAKSKGFFRSLFSWFTRYKCPKCNQRSGKSLSTTLLERTQEVQSMPEGSFTNPVFVQRVVNVSTWQDHVKCQDCGYEWYERSRTRTKA